MENCYDVPKPTDCLIGLKQGRYRWVCDGYRLGVKQSNLIASGIPSPKSHRVVLLCPTVLSGGVIRLHPSPPNMTAQPNDEPQPSLDQTDWGVRKWDPIVGTSESGTSTAVGCTDTDLREHACIS